jgi:methionyl-tRNA synthetase
MPTKSKELLDLLRVDLSKRTLSDTAFGSDLDYGEGVKKKILFPQLIVED